MGDVGLRSEYIDNPRIRLYVWGFLALPHVPPARMEEALGLIETQVAQISQDLPQLSTAVRNLHSYFLRVWVNGSYPPESWSCWERDDQTTRCV